MKTLLLLLVGWLAACGPKEPGPGAGPGPGPGPGPGLETETETGQDVEPNEILDEHNRYRAEHCAPPLVWSDELAEVAQAWADKLVEAGCAFEHSSTRYGENLAAGSTGALPPASVVEMWYREVDAYDFKRGSFSMETGHFTQLVWRDTRKLGCGMSQCNGFDLWVCNYDPPGNVEGQYKQQVLASGCD